MAIAASRDRRVGQGSIRGRWTYCYCRRRYRSFPDEPDEPDEPAEPEPIEQAVISIEE